MKKETRIIGIISGKGGVGKSTVTANIGSYIASKFKKDVVIIDCNLTTSHLSLSLGMYYCPITLNNVLRGEKNIFESMYEHPSGMKIIPASLHLREIERVDITKLKDVIKDLDGKVDFIFLDASPGLGRETYAAIHASEEIILVTNPNLPSIADVIKCREIIKGVKKKPLGIVLNMVNGKKYELSKKEIEALVEIPVIASVPNDNNIHESLANKKPVVMFNPKAKSSKEFKKLAYWLIGEKEKGFFTIFFGKK
jgi:septum site-determining protein MinD